MASRTGPEKSYWQQLIKSGLYLAHWQKERDHDFSQPLVFIDGPSRDRTVDLLIKSKSFTHSKFQKIYNTGPLQPLQRNAISIAGGETAGARNQIKRYP